MSEESERRTGIGERGSASRQAGAANEDRRVDAANGRRVAGCRTWAVRLGVGVLSLGLAGCLPSSQRELDRSLSDADSTSLALAAQAPVDTLAVVWTARAPEADPMIVPTSLVWLPRGVVVVEAQQGGALRRFDATGAYLGRTDLDPEAFHYAAGTRGDTVVVMARGADRLDFVAAGSVARSVPVPPGATHGLATDALLAVRLGGATTGQPAEVAVLRDDGTEAARVPLLGPVWRSAGFLRTWGDSLLALSGYRPVVDVVANPRSAPEADTLALRGFGSPQLVRSAQFARGEVDEPPLLTSSAAPLGDRLFVVNLRADHVRLDVYDRGGTLQRVLVSPGPWAPVDAVPMDLAARSGPDGTVELAVLMARAPGLLQSPDARVVLYRWAPPAPEAV